MDWGTLTGPAVVAAAVSGIISFVGIVVSNRTARSLHTDKLAFDERQAERRVDAEIALLEKRFALDSALAEKRFALDSALADRKRRQDLAEEVLSAFYQVNVLVRSIRSPLTYSIEAKDRPKPEYEDDAVGRQRDEYYAIIARFEGRRQEVADLLARRYRMVAWFGRAAEEPFQLLDEALHTVITSAQYLVEWSGTDVPITDPKDWREMKNNIWWGAGTPDPIAAKIAAAIEKIKGICCPVLKGKSA